MRLSHTRAATTEVPSGAVTVTPLPAEPVTVPPGNDTSQVRKTGPAEPIVTAGLGAPGVGVHPGGGNAPLVVSATRSSPGDNPVPVTAPVTVGPTAGSATSSTTANATTALGAAGRRRCSAIDPLASSVAVRRTHRERTGWRCLVRPLRNGTGGS